MSGREYNLTKNHSPDRILVLKPIEGKEAETASGKVDPRLFTGKNRLHAVMDSEYGHWYLKLEQGQLTETMQQRWTSFPRLLDATKAYFLRRNIEIVEIIDNAE